MLVRRNVAAGEDGDVEELCYKAKVRTMGHSESTGEARVNVG